MPYENRPELASSTYITTQYTHSYSTFQQSSISFYTGRRPSYTEHPAPFTDISNFSSPVSIPDDISDSGPVRQHKPRRPRIEIAPGIEVDVEQMQRLHDFARDHQTHDSALFRFLPQRSAPSVIHSIRNDRVEIPIAAINAFIAHDNALQNRKYVDYRELGRKVWPFVLTTIEMAEIGFVIPTFIAPEAGGSMRLPVGWVEVRLPKEQASKNIRRALAIDCEMVMCGSEQVVSEICVVDFFTEKIVYHTYVSPPAGRIVTDYITPISGITPEILSRVKKTLPEAQEELLRVIRTSNTVLVGHGLQGDLRVLKLAHPKVVDTSLMFDPPHGRKAGTMMDVWQRPKLRELVQAYLGGEGFQNGVHSAADDARACVHLVKFKCNRDTGHNAGRLRYRDFIAHTRQRVHDPYPRPY